MISLAFDLDGCLIDTRAANVAAYREVGVEPPPESAWLPAKEWLRDMSKHAEKQRVYPKHLHLCRLLPASEILFKCGGVILTGASFASVDVIRDRFPDLNPYTVIWGMTVDEKIKQLKTLGTGIYFDNMAHVVKRVREETRWEAVDVSGL